MSCEIEFKGCYVDIVSLSLVPGGGMRAGGSLGFRLVRQRPRSHGTAVSGLHDSGRIVLLGFRDWQLYEVLLIAS